MIDNLIAFGLTMGSAALVLVVAGWLADRSARRESSVSPTAGCHPRRDGPAARLLTMDEAEAERRRQAFTAALSRTIRDLEADRRWGKVSRPIHAPSPSQALDTLLDETTMPRKSQR